MTMTATTFRQLYRQFNDVGAVPDVTLNFWFGLAMNFMAGSNSGAGNRFDPVTLDHAVALFTAHHLTLDARDVATTAAGGVPGELKGPATAKSVDKVSQSYDTKAVTFENEAFWNQTRFGVQLLNLAQMFGAGGIQVDADVSTDSANPFPNFGLNLPG
jgi:hypothetical protein